MISELQKNDIEVRPIVTGNFLKNKELLEHFDYEVGSSMEASELLEKNGFFVGNQQTNIFKQIEHLYNVMKTNF